MSGRGTKRGYDVGLERSDSKKKRGNKNKRGKKQRAEPRLGAVADKNDHGRTTKEDGKPRKLPVLEDRDWVDKAKFTRVGSESDGNHGCWTVEGKRKGAEHGRIFVCGEILTICVHNLCNAAPFGNSIGYPLQMNLDYNVGHGLRDDELLHWPHKSFFWTDKVCGRESRRWIVDLGLVRL